MHGRAGAETAGAVAERALAGAERAGAVAEIEGESREGTSGSREGGRSCREGGREPGGRALERAPMVTIPSASHDIGDTLHISRVTYVD